MFTFNAPTDGDDQAYGVAQGDGKVVVTGYSHGGAGDDLLIFRLM